MRLRYLKLKSCGAGIACGLRLCVLVAAVLGDVSDGRAQSIVTSNLVVNYAADLVDDGVWPETAGVFTGLDRVAVNRTSGQTAVPVLVTYPETLNTIDTWYEFARHDASGADNGELALHLGVPTAIDSMHELVGDACSDRNTSFEIWFRPNTTSVVRQILWETGGGTGTSFTLDGAVLRFRTMSNGNVSEATADVARLIASGEWIQAVGLIDFANNQVKLYTNGVFASESAAGGGNINDWDGGDGDAIGGRGGVNLGGFGNGYTYDGGDYSDFDGQIAAFRVYQDTTAAVGTGTLLSDAEILRNYKAIVPDRAIFNNAAGGNAWTNGGNWVAGVVPSVGTNVFIGDGRNARVASVVSNVAANVVVGHALVSGSGAGTLTIEAGGELTIEHNLAIGTGGKQGDFVQNGGTVDVGNDLMFGQTGSQGGECWLYGGTLHVGGRIYERVSGVDPAQIYLDGGHLVVDGDLIRVQSFRTGNLGGKSGAYVLDGGRKIENTGTFFAGRLGNGRFSILDGELDMTPGNDIRLAAESTAAVGAFIVGGADETNALVTVNAGAKLEIGLMGQGTFVLSNGVVNCLGQTRFGYNGGGGALTIEGGRYALGQTLVVGAAATRGELELMGGELRFEGSLAARDVVSYGQAGGALLSFALSDASDGLTPLAVSGTATLYSAGALVDVGEPPAGSVDANDRTTWIGGTGEWDESSSKWLTDFGQHALPSQAAGYLGPGREYTVLVSSNAIVNPEYLEPASSNWSVAVKSPTEIAVRREGPVLFGGPATAVIASSTSVVTRAGDLRVSPEAGKDCASLEIDAGRLILATGAELVVGDGALGSVHQNGGTVTIPGTLRYGAVGGGTGGGEYHLSGGTLTVDEEISETTINVGSAQMFVDGGTLLGPPSITVQSFRTGNAAGSMGVYTQNVGQSMYVTGSLYAGYNGAGVHNVNGGALLVKNNVLIATQSGCPGGVLNVGTPTTPAAVEIYSDNSGNAEGGLQIGCGGPGTLNITNGTVLSHTVVRFGRLGGGGTLHVNGGTYRGEAKFVVESAATNAAIHLESGRVELLGNPTERSLTDYRQDGGVLQLSIGDLGLLPLVVSGTAAFAPGARLELAGWRNSAVSTASSNAVYWVGGTGEWDADTNKWENAAGARYLPSNGAGFVPTGSVYTVATAGTLDGGSNVTAGAGGFDVYQQDATSLAVRVTGEGVAGGPVTAVIDDPAAVVARTAHLRILPRPEADAAQLVVNDGTLTLAAGADLVIGGNADGVVNQNGGTVALGRDLLFGRSIGGVQGGTYNLNGGTLDVAGDIREVAEDVDGAQVCVNGGTLNVAGRIMCQRFSVAETDYYTNSYVVTRPIETTGDFCAGGLGHSVGTILIDSNSPPLVVSRLRCGQGDHATGTVRVEAGSVTVGIGGVRLAGDSAGDTNTTGTLILGTPEGGAPAVTVEDSNTELGFGGKGTFVMYGGSYSMDRDNFVVGQGAASEATLELDGGTITLRGTDGNGHLNFNYGDGSVTQNGGVLDVRRNVNLSNYASPGAVYTLNGGVLRIGADLDFRNNGRIDGFVLNGGELVFTNAAGGAIHCADRSGDTNRFVFAGGRLHNCATFYGDLRQASGTLEPGAPVGIMRVAAGAAQGEAGDYRLSGGALVIDLLGRGAAGAPDGYDQLVVEGTVDLDAAATGGGILRVDIDPGMEQLAEADLGLELAIIDNVGAGAVQGSFSCGTQLALGDGTIFLVDYAGGDGNDVVLTLAKVPSKGTLLMLR